MRVTALSILRECDPDTKARRALELGAEDASDQTIDPFLQLAEPDGLPGRPTRPELVAPKKLSARKSGSVAGRIALIHALSHIEFNAINLALDAVWRFPNLPAAFYRDWASVAREEAKHFLLLTAHLNTLGHEYGDLPAHDGLWEMAQRTRHDALARIALVPRTLEARGLDASPAVRAKLASAGDAAGAAIIDMILADEIGHVAIGNRWYRWLCSERGLDPHTTYARLALQYDAPIPRGPFNLSARRAAGFDEAELAALSYAS